jgi:hypothetical protein
MSALDQALVRALQASVTGFEGEASAEALGNAEWASVTFSGARHRLRLTLQGAGAAGAAADLLDRLDNLDFPLGEHFLADLALVAEQRSDGGSFVCLDLEALTIRDS